MKRNRSIKSDESGLTITIELLLTFSISAILLSIVALSLQGILSSATEIALYQELGSIGNNIASKIEDLNTMVDIAERSGDMNELSSQITVPEDVGGSPYKIEIESGLIRLTAEINQNIEVKVPFSPKIPVTSCNITSLDKTKNLIFNRTSGTIHLEQAVNPDPDTSPPSIAFISPSPADGSTVNQTVTVKVNATDNVRVSKVEYYVNDILACTAQYPYEWQWNTERYPGGTTQVEAIAYDRSGNTATDSRTYTVIGQEPGVVSDLNATAQAYPDILLTWTRPAIGSVSSYRIYRNASAPIDEINKYTSTLLEDSWFDSPVSYVDSTSKSMGVTYYYAVTCKNSSGVEGLVSNEANATPPLTGTWDSTDLETGSFIPTNSNPGKDYTFTPILLTGTYANEVSVLVQVDYHSATGDPDLICARNATIALDECKTLTGTGSYWFNETAYPNNNTAYLLTVSIEKKNSLDDIQWNFVQVFVDYSS